LQEFPKFLSFLNFKESFIRWPLSKGSRLCNNTEFIFMLCSNEYCRTEPKLLQ